MKDEKLKTFTINYYFDGTGSVDVEAENEEEARELFYEGEGDYKNTGIENRNDCEIEDVETN